MKLTVYLVSPVQRCERAVEKRFDEDSDWSNDNQTISIGLQQIDSTTLN